MFCTLAGQDLMLTSKALVKALGRMVDTSAMLPWASRTWPGAALAGRQIHADDSCRMPTSLMVGQYFHPTGASRWAYGNFPCSGEQLDRIRKKAPIDPDSTSPVEFVTSADGLGSAEVFRAQVTILRAQPLSQIVATSDADVFNNAYLLTIVDARYFAQFAPCPDFGIPDYGKANPATPASQGGGAAIVPWSDLIEMCGQAMGLEVAHDDVDPAYLSPDPSLNLAGCSAALMLDAVAMNIGMIVACSLDGKLTLQSPATAKAARALDDQSPAGTLRSLKGGGDCFADVT